MAEPANGEGGVSEWRASGMNVNFASPLNSGIVRHLKSTASSPHSVSVARFSESQSPDSIADPYYSLGTHPDLLSWFWDDLTTKLPKACQWIVYGAPVLVHPDSGVIFGFAGGTHTYALRLPPLERQAALRAGCDRTRNYPAYPELNLAATTLSLDGIGEEWVFGQWQEPEKDWCFAAYVFAGISGRTIASN